MVEGLCLFILYLISLLIETDPQHHVGSAQTGAQHRGSTTPQEQARGATIRMVGGGTWGCMGPHGGSTQTGAQHRGSTAHQKQAGRVCVHGGGDQYVCMYRMAGTLHGRGAPISSRRPVRRLTGSVLFPIHDPLSTHFPIPHPIPHVHLVCACRSRRSV